jgi:NAD(P)-dependent dehydrogenase (short-subunit alcohol dehydrogenase family)
MPNGPLAGSVCIVTGASRGVGKGIALELGAAGATVYVTGRSRAEGDGPLVFDQRLPGTVDATAAEVTAAGGKGIPVVLDHRDDDAVKALYDRVESSEGRLDLLVNNAYLVPAELLSGLPFWELPLNVWDDMTDVGVRSTYVASVFGARMMVARGKGLIVNTSSSGGGRFSMTPAYGVGKVAVDRMAFDMAYELRSHGVAAVSIWLGLISTERTYVAAQHVPRFDISIAESPRFVGRGVVALATDPDVMSISGSVVYSAELAGRYGFTDENGKTPASRRSLFGDPPQFRA